MQVGERRHAVHCRHRSATVERSAARTVIEGDGDQAGELGGGRVRGVAHGDLDGSDPLAGAGAFRLRREGQPGGTVGSRGRWRPGGVEQLIEPAGCNDDGGERQKAEHPHGCAERRKLRTAPATGMRPYVCDGAHADVAVLC